MPLKLALYIYCYSLTWVSVFTATVQWENILPSAEFSDFSNQEQDKSNISLGQ